MKRLLILLKELCSPSLKKRAKASIVRVREMRAEMEALHRGER